MTDNATRVEVSITLRDALSTTTITKDSMPYGNHAEMQAALLSDLIGLARADLQVDEEEVWTFGREFESESSDG